MESKDGFGEVIAMATSKPDEQDKPGNVVHNARKRRVSGVMNEGFKSADDEAA